MWFSRIRDSVRTSLWFVPACFAVGATVLWALFAVVDRDSTVTDVPVGFGGTPEGARAVLLAISGSMITVTGVVFSVTIVALQLASSQFSPRVLRTFLRDRTVQVSLGAFIASFWYSLLVLRTVRDSTPSEPGYVPRASVSMAFVILAFGLVMFVAYINHIAQSIRAARIIQNIGAETHDAMQRFLADAEHGDGQSSPHDSPRQGLESGIVCSERSGVVIAFDHDRLVSTAANIGALARASVHVGDFVPTGAPLLELRSDGPHAEIDDNAISGFRDGVLIGRHRVLERDVAFGIRQIVDIALRALSPSLNDPTTAVQCIDQLHDLLRASADEAFPSGIHLDSSRNPRFIERTRSWDDLLDLALEEIIHAGASTQQIPRRVARMLDDLSNVVPSDRRPAIERQALRLEHEMRAAHADSSGTEHLELGSRVVITTHRS